MIPSLNYQTENDTNHIYERIINNESIKSFKQRLSETDWHEIEVSENPDEPYKTFLHKYLAVQYMREIEKWSHFTWKMKSKFTTSKPVFFITRMINKI